MKTYFILNDNTKKLKHWHILNPNNSNNILGFAHPNYVIEKIKENDSFIEQHNQGTTVFLVDNCFANRKLLHSEQMDYIKDKFSQAKFYVASGFFEEGEKVKGYAGSIGSYPLTIEALEEKINELDKK